MSLVLTKAALAAKDAQSNFQVVKFESYKSKKKEKSENVEQTVQKRPGTQKDMDLKRIRHEIVRFGMSGFDATKKEEAKIALAVSLGAKPPKKEYVNYKELMAKRKEEKQKKEEEKQSMISKSILQRVSKKKKKGPGNDVGHFLSNYGKVNKKDLKKDKSGKGKGGKGPAKKKKKLI
ncbi:40S small subunit processome assembly factor 1 [Epargyreus clarus]|uniref:40S small subunit processome assembly factor 1 n=1 Tax=Epargyreus clarus TaxID=520877 RepID=UPI003C2EA362